MIAMLDEPIESVPTEYARDEESERQLMTAGTLITPVAVSLTHDKRRGSENLKNFAGIRLAGRQGFF